MKRVYWCFILFVSSLTHGAVLSLDSCLQMAERNNYALQQASLAVEKSEQVKKAALTHYFPQVSLVGVGYHALNPLVDVGIDDLPNAGVRDILNTLYTNYGAALGLDKSFGFMSHGVVATVSAVQPIYMGGKIVAGNRLAATGVEADKLKWSIAHRDLLLSVEESYWLVVSLEAKRQTIGSVSLLLDTVHTMVSSAVLAGLALPNDLLQVEMRQDELAAQRLQLEDGLLLARRALCQSIGVPYSDSLQLSDTLPLTVLPTAPYDQTVNRPESDLLALQVQAEHLKKRMTLADALPQVALGGVYGYMNYLSPFSQTAANQFLYTEQSRYMNGVLGVMVRVPLTSWWETGHHLKEHNLAIRQAELQQKDMNEKMLLQQEQAYDHWQESAALLIRYQHTVEHARENYRLCALHYQSGMQTISDLLQAEALYLQSENNLTDARIQCQIAMQTYEALTQGRGV